MCDNNFEFVQHSKYASLVLGLAFQFSIFRRMNELEGGYELLLSARENKSLVT